MEEGGLGMEEGRGRRGGRPEISHPRDPCLRGTTEIMKFVEGSPFE